MRFSVSGRAAGKSRKLMQLMLSNPDLIYIASTQREADDMKRRFQEFSPAAKVEDRFYSWQTAREAQTGKSVRPCVIDNLDLVLPMALGLGYSIEHVTATGIVDPL